MKTITFILSLLLFGNAEAQQFEQVAMNKRALDFSLKTIQGEKLTLSEIYKNQPVVLVVLRGWPGYQCPVCTKQVGTLVAEGDKFSELKATVLMVYPGPSDDLQNHAKEFAEDFSFPENFYFTLDPDYSMINKYGLRWDAPKETAYPSTFVINKNGIVVYSKISTTHGDRAINEDIFKILGELNSAK